MFGCVLLTKYAAVFLTCVLLRSLKKNRRVFLAKQARTLEKKEALHSWVCTFYRLLLAAYFVA